MNYLDHSLHQHSSNREPQYRYRSNVKQASTNRRWQDELLRSKANAADAAILPILANAITALRLAPEWQNVLPYDEFRSNVVALLPTPWGARVKGGWTDHEDRLTAE